MPRSAVFGLLGVLLAQVGWFFTRALGLASTVESGEVDSRFLWLKVNVFLYVLSQNTLRFLILGDFCDHSQ